MNMRADNFFSGYLTRRLYWQDRRNWTKRQNAADRAAKLATTYTPRQLRLTAQADQMDHAYRFARDAMRDALDAGFTYKKAALNLHVWFKTLDANPAAVGADRMAQLNTLYDQVQHLPVKTDPSTILYRLIGIGVLVFYLLGKMS
jgi:hypothetical protein